MLTITDFYAQRRHSMVPCEHPDPNQYPLYYNAKKMEVVLNEGDVLYIPFGWWHFVFSESVNPKTKMNIAMSNWTMKHECDCKLFTSKKDYIMECPTYPIMTEGVYKIHHNKSQPFVVKTSLHTSLDMNYKSLKSYFKDYLLNVTTSKTTFFTSQHLHDGGCTKVKMTFDDFYQKGLSGEHVYLAQCSVDISLNLFSFNNELRNRFLWVNFGNIASNMHYDTEDNMLVQIQGTKRVLLFPPSEKRFLYPYNPYPSTFLCYLINKIENGAQLKD